MYCVSILFTYICASAVAQYQTYMPPIRLWPKPTASSSPILEDISYSSHISPEPKPQELPRHTGAYDLRKVALDKEPPSFYESLHEFDKGMEILKSHFTKEALINKNGRDINYVVLVHVIKQLAKEVSRTGWASYYNNYQALVKQNVDKAYRNPEQVAKNFVCEVVEPLEGLISEIRKIIQQPVVQSVCMDKPDCCDSAIWVAMALNPSPNMREAIAAITTAGKAADIFLHLYSDNFETISNQNPYDYLFSARDVLRQLVEADAHVYDVIGESQCS